MVNIESTRQNTRFNTQMPIEKQDSVSALQVKVRYLCDVCVLPAEDPGYQTWCSIRSDDSIYSNAIPLRSSDVSLAV